VLPSIVASISLRHKLLGLTGATAELENIGN